MRIRDSHAEVNGDKTEYEMPSGSLDVIGEGGRTLFSVAIADEGNSIRVSAVGRIRVIDRVYSERLRVVPSSTNVIFIERSDCQ